MRRVTLPLHQERLASLIGKASWLLENRAKALQYTYVAQVLTGLFLLVLSYAIGKDHFHLIREGVRTHGAIIAYKTRYYRTTSWPSSAFMPIVEFRAGDRVVQFEDWVGSRVTVTGIRVSVLYDPANPSTAMIDRRVMNWIPWAPMFALGLFLLLVGTKDYLRASTQANT